MGKLFLLLFGARKFLLFLLLELICLWMIVRFNSFQGVAFHSTSNSVSGNVLSITSDITGYFDLKKGNYQLAAENAQLNNKIIRLKQQLVHVQQLKNQNLILKQQLMTVARLDSLNKFVIDTLGAPHLHPMEDLPAQVISNTINRDHNFVSLDKGLLDGVNINMGVVGTLGIVGKVLFVSENYCTIKSILHSSTNVSVIIKKCGELGSVLWPGDSHRSVDLEDIPRHVKLSKGDTIVTSGYNSVYPSGIPIGLISEFRLSKSATFYDIDVELINDFSHLDFVYVVKNYRKEELLTLNNKTNTENGR